MSPRDPAPRRSRPSSTRGAARTPAATSSATPARRAGPRTGAAAGRPARRRFLDESLVVGDVPVPARLAGALLAVAGLIGALAPFLPQLVVGGQRVGQVTGPGGAAVALLLPVAALVAGGSLAAGRVPRAGLAYAGVAGALAVGRLCIELYGGQESTSRPGTEVVAGTLVTTSSVVVRSGWVLGVVALALTVLAGLLAMAAWGRTVMEDGGSLDPARPLLAGTAALLGALTVLCLTLPAVDVPDEVVTDPSTGLQSVVSREGPQALLERPGLALLGGLLLAGGLLLCAVIAPSLRPRLAVVGGLGAVALVVLGAGLTGLRDAVTSGDVEWTVPGMGLLALGALDVGLVVWAWLHQPAPRQRGDHPGAQDETSPDLRRG